MTGKSVWGVVLGYIAAGCLSFAFFYLFDLNKQYGRFKKGGFLFAAGFIMLMISTVGVFLEGFGLRKLPSMIHWMLYISAAIAGILTLYALFFALPFRRTYIRAEKEGDVIDTGLYALCRHPGVIFFFFMYLFLAMASESVLVYQAMLCWTLMDVIHVWVQDRYFFPKALKGYQAYQQSTPFLIPTARSVQRCVSTLRKGGDPNDSRSETETKKI